MKLFNSITTALLLSFFITIGASAQVKVNIVACPQVNESFSVRAGSDLDIPINSRWSFVPGIYWSLRNRQSTSRASFNDVVKVTKYSDKANFATLPLRFGLYFPCNNEEKLNIKILFGPYIAYGISGTSKTTVNKDGKITKVQVGAFDSNGRYKNRLDYGLNCGFNIQIKKHYIVGAFSEFGLRKIYNADSLLEDIVGEILIVNKINIALGLSLGYQF